MTSATTSALYASALFASALFASALYAAVLLTALWCGFALVDGEPQRGRRFPRATLVTGVLVAVPSLLQLTVAAGLLEVLQRDRTAIEGGQLWRLVTALLVQDGGWPGAVFNLMSLALLGTVAERLWGSRRWLVIALSAGVGAQGWGLLVQPVGAGNSVINFGLAAALSVLALRTGPRPARALAVISLVGALVLLVIGDLHGGAAAIGICLAWRMKPPGSGGPAGTGS